MRKRHRALPKLNAKPFVTHHNALDQEMFLRIAPELYLKRLVVGGFERVFEINRNFRNEGISVRHNPEFTMMEFYAAYWNHHDLMDFTEKLFQRVAERVLGTTTLQYQGTAIELGGNWERISVEDAVLKYSPLKDRAKLRDRAALLAYGKEQGLPMNPKDSTGGLLMVVFDEQVKKHLVEFHRDDSRNVLSKHETGSCFVNNAAHLRPDRTVICRASLATGAKGNPMLGANHPQPPRMFLGLS